MRPLALPTNSRGRVWLHAMPGRGETWVSFLSSARRADIDQVVCLTPLHEVAGLSPAYHGAIREGELPFGWMHLPMRNFGLALHADEFQAGLERVADRVRSGDDVLLHCAAGIGRTGTAAACLLKSLGLSAEEALQRVRAAGSDPESALQSGLIHRF